MARKTYSYDQRVRLLIAAMDLCPNCEKEFRKFAEVPGRDAFELFREVIWKWFGQWSHGRGCPPEAFPGPTQDSPGTRQEALEPAPVQPAPEQGVEPPWQA